MNPKQNFFFLLFLFHGLLFNSLHAQDSLCPGMEFKKHFSPNGYLLSQGCEKDGKPEGYRKNFYQGNILKSEGYFKNHLIDSAWRFFDSTGRLTSIISYKQGKKNGPAIRYLTAFTQHTYYLNDLKHGLSIIYGKNNALLKATLFENGFENGFSREYDTLNTLQVVTEYKRGVLLGRYVVNRRDGKGNKVGRWLSFYENGQLMLDEFYQNNLRNGYSKRYSNQGVLQSVSFYSNDSLLVRPSYIPQDTQAFVDSNQLVSRDFGSSEVREGGNSVLISDNDVCRYLHKQAGIKAEGKTEAGKPKGLWKFFYPSGKLLQTGEYDRFGLASGEWCFYSEDGKLLRNEQYFRGKRDGPYIEFDGQGNTIAKGQYTNDLCDGLWEYTYGVCFEKGVYQLGLRVGKWILKNGEGRLLFEGSYEGGLAHGMHRLWFDNGQLSETGRYNMGKREGSWVFYQNDGSESLHIVYHAGEEIKWEQANLESVNSDQDD